MLSALEPPVSATRRVPPFLICGAELRGSGAEDPPQAAMPRPGMASAPVAARLFSTARRSMSMLARGGSPPSGGAAFMRTSLCCWGGRAGRIREEARRDSEDEADWAIGREIAVSNSLRYVPAVAWLKFKELTAGVGSESHAEHTAKHVAALVAAAGLPVTELPGVELTDGDGQMLAAREQAQRNRPRAPGLEAPAAIGAADHAHRLRRRGCHFGWNKSSKQIVVAQPYVCQQFFGPGVRTRRAGSRRRGEDLEYAQRFRSHGVSVMPRVTAEEHRLTDADMVRLAGHWIGEDHRAAQDM